MGGKFATYSSYGEFLDELGALVGGLSLYAPVIERGYPEYEYHADHALNPRYCRVIPLPAHPRGDPSARIIRNYAVQFNVFLRDVRRWRRALIYTPSVTASLATVAWRVMHAHPQRLVAYVWGDWQQLAQVLPQNGLLRRLLDPIQRRLLLRQEGWLVRHADVTLVAGPALLRRYTGMGKIVTETNQYGLLCGWRLIDCLDHGFVSMLHWDAYDAWYDRKMNSPSMTCFTAQRKVCGFSTGRSKRFCTA